MRALLKGFSSFFSLLVSILIYILTILLLLVLSVRCIFSFHTINRLIQNIEVKEILLDIDENDDIMHSIYESSKAINISKESVDSLLNSYTIKYLVSEYIYGEIYFLTSGSEERIITDIKLNDYININIDKILKEGKIDYSSEEKQSLVNLVKDNSKGILDSLPGAKTIINNIDESSLYYIRLAFSSYLIFILGASLLITIILLMLFRWSPYKWMKWFGISIMCSSLICVAVGLLPMFDFTSLIPGLPLYLNNLIESSKIIVSSNFIYVGVACFIVGILLLTIGLFISKKKKDVNMDLQSQ